MKKIVMIILVVVLLLGIAAYFGASYMVYDRLSAITGISDPDMVNIPSNFSDRRGWWGNEFDYEAYFVPTYDDVRLPSREEGIEIAGWYFAGDADAPAAVVVHGGTACRRTHQVLVPASMLWQNGFNVLVIDVRDVGDSTVEDGRSAVGNEEYLDVLGAWDWLAAEKGFAPDRIGLLGNSLGGGTVLIAFSMEPGVPAVVLDSPPEDLKRLMQEELARNNYPQFLASGAILMARLVSGDNLTAHNPGDAIANSNSRPMFIMQGTADERLDYHHSVRLCDRAEELGMDNVECWFEDGIDHVRMALHRTEQYEERVVDFFRQALDT